MTRADGKHKKKVFDAVTLALLPAALAWWRLAPPIFGTRADEGALPAGKPLTGLALACLPSAD